MPNPDTDEWKISAQLDYVPKVEWVTEKCSTCGGTGMCGGGFKSLDDPEPCTKCGGSGETTKQVYPKSPKPKLPQDLIDYMRKAYLEYKLS